jgi:hypothetical protein
LSELTEAQRIALGGGLAKVAAAQLSSDSTVNNAGLSGSVDVIAREWLVNFDDIGAGAGGSIAVGFDAIGTLVSGGVVQGTGRVGVRTGATNAGSTAGSTLRASATQDVGAGATRTKIAFSNDGASFTNPGGVLLVQVCVTYTVDSGSLNLFGTHVRIG